MPLPPANTNTAPNALLAAWGHDASDVSAGGLEYKRTATEAERAALAKALDVLGCEALSVVYRIKRAPIDGYRLTGKVTAELTQACVVTLAPVHETVAVPLDVDFRPEDEARLAEGGAVDLDETTEVEPMDGTWLPVGRIVFEEVAAGLNPYPRRPGAEFTPIEEGASTAAKANPFAVLANLKTPPKTT